MEEVEKQEENVGWREREINYLIQIHNLFSQVTKYMCCHMVLPISSLYLPGILFLSFLFASEKARLRSRLISLSFCVCVCVCVCERVSSQTRLMTSLSLVVAPFLPLAPSHSPQRSP